MKTVRRLFYRDILSSVGFVAAAFLTRLLAALLYQVQPSDPLVYLAVAATLAAAALLAPTAPSRSGTPRWPQ